MMKVHGQSITTAYGDGYLISRRSVDGISEIELPFGILYLYQDPEDEVPYCPSEQELGDSYNLTMSKKNERFNADDLNFMYESLEKMRRLNLEIACERKGVRFDETALLQCSHCLLETDPPSSADEPDDGSAPIRFPRVRRLMEAQKQTVQKARQSLLKMKPCLVCGAPTCKNHSSASFSKENITLCLGCEHYFSVKFVVECLTAPTPQDRLFLMDRMIDVYDRTLLLLRFSSQYIPEVAASLEESSARANRVGVGSSGAGVVSGVLGVCAAATILTPAGPSLLMASLLFGGSATAVQTGSELRRYYSEPNQLADRTIALHGMIRTVLRVATSLRDVITHDHRESGMYEHLEEEVVALAAMERETRFRTRALAGMTAGRAAAAGLEMCSLAAAAEVAGSSLSVAAATETAALNASLWNRSGMALLRSARVVRLAGGALSAATLALEAKALNDTLKRIQAGNPCEKADMLREIKEDLDDLPDAGELFTDIERCLQLIAHRRKNMTEEEALSAFLESQFRRKHAESSLILVTDEKEGKRQSENIADGRDRGFDENLTA